MRKFDHTSYFNSDPDNPPYVKGNSQNGRQIPPLREPTLHYRDGQLSLGTKAWDSSEDFISNYNQYEKYDGRMEEITHQHDDDKKKNGKLKPKRWFTGKFFKDFCNETSIHGFNHIVAPNRHILEKIGWAITTLLAALGAVQLCLEQWQRYVASPTVMALEKDYRTWNNTFLALTACLAVRFEPTLAVRLIDRIWNIDPSHEKYNYYLQFAEVVANATLNDLSVFNPYVGDTSLKDVDLFQIATEVAPPFKGLVAWFDRGINTSFVNVMTERGVCHTINSIVSGNQAVKLPASKNPVSPKQPISCHYITHPCYMRVELYQTCIAYYVHSPYDVLDISTETTVSMCTGQDYNTDWKVAETRASLDVHALAIDQRKCRFHIEHPAGKGREYSNSVCRQECRQRMAVKLCGCKPFFYFQNVGPMKPCGPEGMVCLSKHRDSLNRLAGCSCLPQCVDATYEITYYKDSRWTGPFAERSSIKLGILPPRSRYRRQILFCFEDLVVSFGGAAGLFLGCSFLSGVEIVYFILARSLASIRNIFGGKRISQNGGGQNIDKMAVSKDIALGRKRRELDKEKIGMRELIGRIAEFE